MSADNAGGGAVRDLNLGCLYFGRQKSVACLLRNTSPLPCMFSSRITRSASLNSSESSDLSESKTNGNDNALDEVRGGSHAQTWKDREI